MHVMAFLFQVISSSAIAAALLGGTVKLVHIAQSKALLAAVFKSSIR